MGGGGGLSLWKSLSLRSASRRCAYLQFPECPWEGAASLVSKDVAGPQTKDRLIFRASGACTN